jgi:hypothetical protein
MSSISQVSETMQTILTSRAKALERESGFVERSTAQLDGPIFSQTTVLTWMQNPDASYSQLRHTAASLGVHVSNQAIEQRFGQASVRLVHALLEETIDQAISSEASAPEVLARFNGVYVQDGTVISFPSSLAKPWPGGESGSGLTGPRSARTGLRQPLGTLAASGPGARAQWPSHHYPPAGRLALPWGYELFHARRDAPPRRAGAVLADASQGHADPHRSARPMLLPALLLTSAKGRGGGCGPVRGQAGALTGAANRCARVARGSQAAPPAGPGAHHASAQRLSSSSARQAQAESEQRQGKRKGKKISAARLRLADWTIVLTNVPKALLSVQEALVLLRVRWQIELLWKLWKQHGKLDTWRSYKPERILTEFYAKLLGLVFTHWHTLLGCWQAPNRSLLKAKQVVEWMTPCLALALTGVVPVPTVVERTAQMMQTGCTINSRRKRPNTYQLLADPRLVGSLG